jgi:hypothetical protein
LEVLPNNQKALLPLIEFIMTDVEMQDYLSKGIDNIMEEGVDVDININSLLRYHYTNVLSSN